MREILFRGKRADAGEYMPGSYGDWVYGSYGLKLNVATGEDDEYIMESVYNGATNSSYFVDYKIIPGTAGQYTGMTDKNGNKIFEGDVVSAWSQGVHAKGKIAQRVDGYWIMYPSYQENIMWYLAPDADGRTDIEIIGNIHDEGEEENEI